MRWYVSVVALCASLSSIAMGDMMVYYDVENAPDGVMSLSPNYVGTSGEAVTASTLHVVGLNIPNASDLGGPGDFVFSGWTGDWYTPRNRNQYFEFTITPDCILTPKELKYTFFSGMWSWMGSVRSLEVYASVDGFATETLISSRHWCFPQTSPFERNNPNDFSDDLSMLGVVSPGTTLSIRFFAFNPDYAFIPSGFWNKGGNDYNVTFLADAELVPEPCSVISALVGFGTVGLMSLRRRKGR